MEDSKTRKFNIPEDYIPSEKEVRTSLVNTLQKEGTLNYGDVEYIFNLNNWEPGYDIKYCVQGYDSFGDSKVFPVYPPEKGLVAKFEGNNKNFEYLENELRIQQKAYAKGLSVPCPKGIFNVYNIKENDVGGALVMERVPGVQLDLLRMKVPEEVMDLVEEEYRKAEEAEFFLADHFHNVLYDVDKKKVYLIDLEDWEYDGD